MNEKDVRHNVPAFFLPDADAQVRRICEERLQGLYGEQPQIRARLEQELERLGANASVFLLCHKLVKHLQKKGAVVGFSGTVGSTLIAYLMEITDVNPLPAHHYCPVCQHVEFAQAASGYDLPKKSCPHCGTPMQGDGHDIPFETCMGVQGHFWADIELVVSDKMRLEARRFLVNLLGKGRLAVVGAGENAYCPGGIMLLPEGMEWEEIAPVCLREDGICEIAPHMDYHTLEGVTKLDVLPYFRMAQLQELFAVTQAKASVIDYRDPEVYALFRDGDTAGVPEFSGKLPKELLSKPDSVSFGDLVRVSGMTHGMNVWHNNGENLMQEHPFEELLATRDDVFMTLRQYGVDRQTAYAAMTRARRGDLHHDRPRARALLEKLRQDGVPEWCVDSIQKMDYLFPKAHAVRYARQGYLFAWFKVYHRDHFCRVLGKKCE